MLGDSQFQPVATLSNPNSQLQLRRDPAQQRWPRLQCTPQRRATRKPGRPATYVFDKPDDELTEKERKMKISIEKRRLRQNRSYHRRKKVRKIHPTSTPSASVPGTVSVSNPVAPATNTATNTTTATLQHALASVTGAAVAGPSSTIWQLGTPDGESSSADALAAAAVAASMPNLSQTASEMAAHSQTPRPQHSPPPPRFIKGFAQNPLDLLASATAEGESEYTPSASRSPSLERPDSDTSNVEEDVNVSGNRLLDSTINPDGVTGHPVDLSTIPSQSRAEAAAAAVAAVAAAPMIDPALTVESLMPPVPSIDATLEIDATSAPMEDMSSFSLELDGHKGEDDVEEEDPTDELVKSALVAAKEYAAKDALNLKAVMDRETDLRRMTGIKTIVFDNLRSKYFGMTPDMQSALRHFIIFPRTFNLKAAAAVAGLDDSQDGLLVSMQGMLNSMIETNFMTTSKGRYELNEAARLFLSEDTAVLNDNIASGCDSYNVAQKRFVDHYRKQLGQLQDDEIHKVGWLREQAMALFDCERVNMEFSEYLLNGRNGELRRFLSAGITVMRYCVSASSRERLLRKALSEDETSTEDIFLSLVPESVDVSSLGEASLSSETGNIKEKEEENSHRARLQLALSEAYFDQLKMDEAEQPLLVALKLMEDTRQKCGVSSSNVVDSVLVLLLLSNLRLTANRVKEARVLCVKALKILAEAGLGWSTFGMNAMTNLVTIYLLEGHLVKAKSVASRLLDTLNTMQYTGMPIYADALGVCAMVSMAEGRCTEAERQYGRALETMAKWGSKDWTGIPLQHCLDLDLWLMEGLAESIRRQGKLDIAAKLELQAAEDRESRGLPKQVSIVHAIPFGSGGVPSSVEVSGRGSHASLRHLY